MNTEVFIFLFSLIIGIIAPLSGVGGGVLFVPLLTAFTAIDVDFIRGGGLMVALMSAITSSPLLIRKGYTNLRMILPVILVTNFTAFIGGYLGLYISNAFPQGKYYIVLMLGVILGIILVIMLVTKRVEFPEPKEKDVICRTFGMEGKYFEPTLNKEVEYHASRTPISLIFFALVGLIAGMFGLGAGWANVPVLNLGMLLPIRIAVSTSMLIILVNTSIAAWVYIAKGAIIPKIVIPAMVGMAIGSRIGAWLTTKVRAAVIRYTVIVIMLMACATNIYKGVAGLMGWI